MVDTAFRLGQLIEKDFEGELEGVPVKVTKRLWVHWMRLQVNPDHSAYSFSPTYRVEVGLCENDPARFPNVGKEYQTTDLGLLRAVEPVIESIAMAQPMESPSIKSDVVASFNESRKASKCCGR